MNEISVLSVAAESLIADALHGLRDSTGISGTMLLQDVGGNSAAVALEVAGKTLRYRCELKQKIDRFLVLDDMKARSVVNRSRGRYLRHAK
jgi:hypothetical protein